MSCILCHELQAECACCKGAMHAPGSLCSSLTKRRLAWQDPDRQVCLQYMVQDPDAVFKKLQDLYHEGNEIPDFTPELRELLVKNVRRRMTPQPLKIRADVQLTCFAYDGVLHIQVGCWRRTSICCGQLQIWCHEQQVSDSHMRYRGSCSIRVAHQIADARLQSAAGTSCISRRAPSCNDSCAVCRKPCGLARRRQ